MVRRGGALRDLSRSKEAERQSIHRLRQGKKISLLLALSVLLIASITLIVGWGLGLDRLVRFYPDWPAMVPTTAFLFLLSGFGLLYYLKTGHRWAVFWCGIGLIVLTSSFMHELIPQYWPSVSDGISIATRFEFFLAGVSFAVLATARNEVQFLLVLPSTLGLMIVNVALIGFVFFNANFMSYNPFLAKLGISTAVSFLLLHLAILFAARRPLWPHLLLGSRPGSKLLRTLLPCAVFGPIILGEAAYIATQSGHLGVRVSISVLVVASGWLVIVALFLATRWINTVSDQEKAILRRLHERELALSNAEAMAARVHKVSSLGRVAGGVSHEFNNLLSVIQGNLELLRENRTGARADDEQFLSEALDATRRGAGLTQKLLSYGEKSVLDPEDLVLDRNIEALEGMLRRFIPEHVEFLVEPGAERRRIHADRGQLEQAVFSLVSNAAESLEGPGHIILATGRLELQETRNEGPDDRPMPAGDYLFVSVSDTGCGIPKDQIARITEPFFSTKSFGKSPGLGLSMVQGFCLQSGGFLEFSSTPGIGSRFVMYFPERQESTPAQPDTTASQADTFQRSMDTDQYSRT